MDSVAEMLTKANKLHIFSSPGSTAAARESLESLISARKINNVSCFKIFKKRIPFQNGILKT